MTLFTRAVVKRKLNDVPTLAGWAQLFCAVLVYSLQGEAVERAVDARFHGLPVALYTKYFGTLIWFYLYFRILRQVIPIHRLYPWIERVFPLIAVVGLVTMPMVATPAHRQQARDLITGIRDLGMIIPVVVIFIPLTWRIRQRETIGGMRLKQMVIILCYAGYVVIACGNILKATFTFLDQNRRHEIESIFTPVLLFSLFLFILLLLPFRWTVLIHYPKRLLTYYRLRRLERDILHKMSEMNKMDGVHRLQMNVERSAYPPLPFQLEALELEIYRAVINLLDYAGVLAMNVSDVQTRTLAKQVQDIAKTYPSYSALVYHLSRIDA